jgi:hypothetical protein
VEKAQSTRPTWNVVSEDTMESTTKKRPGKLRRLREGHDKRELLERIEVARTRMRKARHVGQVCGDGEDDRTRDQRKGRGEGTEGNRD